MKKTILFDLDGTLIDSTSAILDGFKTSFSIHGKFYPSDEDIKAIIGYPLDIMFAKLGVENEFIESFVNAYKIRYQSIFLESTTLIDSAKEAIEEAYEFADLGIVTTKTSKYSVILLENLGVAKYFAAIIGRDDVINAKPHPEPILKALEAMQKPYQNTYMIGDTKLDAIAANEAKIHSVCLTCGYGKEAELKKFTTNIFPTPLDAVRFIKVI